MRGFAAAAAAAVFLCLLSLSLAAEEQQKQQGPIGQLEAFGKQGPNHGIDEVDGFLPPKEFFENYVTKNKPLLFKGAAKQSPAFKLWTDAYFLEKTPPRPLGDVFIEKNKKENRSQGYSYIHFKEFLGKYNTSDIYMVSDVPPFLLQDLVLPLPLQCKGLLRGALDLHVVWFSSGGTSSVIHHDTYENINCLYRGRKTLVFLNSTKYPDAVKKIIDRDDGGFSSADVDKIDVEKRPEFSGLEFHVGSMDTGDCLYIPYLWIHQVRSFGNNLAVNVWWPRGIQDKLKGCVRKTDTKATFDRVMFRAIHETMLKDAEGVRQAVAMNMGTRETLEQFLEFVGEKNRQVIGNAEIAAAAKALFEALDLNGDGKLTKDDLQMKMKRRQYETVRRTADKYNVAVYLVRNDPAISGELPKYFKTSISDENIFGVHTTWPLPAEALEDDEESEKEYDKSLEDLDLDSKDGETLKEEL